MSYYDYADVIYVALNTHEGLMLIEPDEVPKDLQVEIAETWLQYAVKDEVEAAERKVKALEAEYKDMRARHKGMEHYDKVREYFNALAALAGADDAMIAKATRHIMREMLFDGW